MRGTAFVDGLRSESSTVPRITEARPTPKNPTHPVASHLRPPSGRTIWPEGRTFLPPGEFAALTRRSKPPRPDIACPRFLSTPSRRRWITDSRSSRQNAPTVLATRRDASPSSTTRQQRLRGRGRGRMRSVGSIRRSSTDPRAPRRASVSIIWCVGSHERFSFEGAEAADLWTRFEAGKLILASEPYAYCRHGPGAGVEVGIMCLKSMRPFLPRKRESRVSLSVMTREITAVFESRGRMTDGVSAETPKRPHRNPRGERATWPTTKRS